MKKIVTIYPKMNGGITAVVATLEKGGLFEDEDSFLWPSAYEAEGSAKLFYCVKQYLLYIFFYLRVRPDICHIHLSSYGSFYRKIYYILISKLFGSKVIVHVHSSHFVTFVRNAKSLRRNVISSVMNSCDLVIVLTQGILDQLSTLKDLSLKSATVVHNPICLSNYHFSTTQSRDRNRLVYLGWITEAKGVYDLLEAAPGIKEKIPDFTLDYYGNKETEKLSQLLRERHLEDYVTVHGWIDSDRKNAVLKTATALILPSYTEGIPNVILEAMATGLPIITTSVGGIPDILKDDINCTFCTPGDPVDIAEKVVSLLLSSEKQEAISAQNLISVEQYDSVKICQHIQSIYDEI
jgi:glycosyltransferase involved in cell wall biosynthesis